MLLARRDYSVAEIQQKLISKGFDETVRDEVIEQYLDAGWLDDRRFVS